MPGWGLVFRCTQPGYHVYSGFDIASTFFLEMIKHEMSDNEIL